MFSFGLNEQLEPVADHPTSTLPFADGEPTSISWCAYMTPTRIDAEKQALVDTGVARWSTRWPGRVEPVGPRPDCEPHSDAHKAYAATFGPQPATRGALGRMRPTRRPRRRRGAHTRHP